MNSKHLSILIFLLFTVSCQHVHKKTTTENEINSLIAKTVLIDATTMDGGSGWGSGFILNSFEDFSLIMTAAHVAENKVELLVSYKNQTYPATVVQLDEEMDLALIKVDANLNQRSLLADGYLGEEITCIGWPVVDAYDREQRLSVSKGVISTYRFKEHLNRVTAEIFFGSSGGACFNENKEVVGMPIQVRLLGGAWKYYVVPGSSMKKFVDKALKTA